MKRKLIVKILLVFVTTFILLGGCFYCIKNADFKIENKDNIIEIGLNEKLDLSKEIKVCYRIFFHCFKTKITYDKNIKTNELKTYETLIHLKYKNKVKNEKIIIKVVDKIAPKITLKEEEYQVCPNGKVPKYQVEAHDNIDGDVSLSIKASYTDDNLYFEAHDSRGNKARKRAKSKIQDTNSPKIELTNGNVVYLIKNEQYNEPGFVANDDCDGNITDKVVVSGEVNPSVSGSYTINYKVSDSNGNITEINRIVYVLSGDMNNGSSKIIFLTFDDGPSAYTNQLLDILKKYNVKVTFFVTNAKGQYGDNITRAYNEGHTIGLHTFTHQYSIYSSIDAYFNDLYTIQNYVESLTGSKSYVMRFPGGSSNTVSRSYSQGIMSILTTEVENRGFRYWDWNVSTGDGGTATTEQVISNAIAGIQRNNTSFVLMHDTKGDTVNGVESIIQYGLANGYDFLPLSISAPSCHHGVNN